MKKQLYFTVKQELMDIAGIDGKIASHWKYITVYEITNNQPKIFAEIVAYDGDVDTVQIQWWLDNNGYGDDEFEFTEL